MTFAEGVRGSDPDVASTIEDLKEIKKIYDGIDPGSGAVTISTEKDEEASQPKKLVIGGSGQDSQPSLTNEEFEALKAEVMALRSKIINS